MKRIARFCIFSNLSMSPLRLSDNPYLGLQISNDLKWSIHINNVCKKANATLGFLRRNLRNVPENCRKTAYISLYLPFTLNVTKALVGRAGTNPSTTLYIKMRRRLCRLSSSVSSYSSFLIFVIHSLSLLLLVLIL
jgi:hypothetical protein